APLSGADRPALAADRGPGTSRAELRRRKRHGGGDEVGRRLAATLRAQSTEPGESGRRLAQGSLPAEVEPGGFELISAGTGESGAQAGERGKGRREAAAGQGSSQARR